MDVRLCGTGVGCEAETSLRLLVFALDALGGGHALAITGWMTVSVDGRVVVSFVVFEGSHEKLPRVSN